MEGRKKLTGDLNTPMMIEVDGERFAYNECFKFAEIANMPADIHDTVMKTLDKRFIRLVVVSDGPVRRTAYGITDGWYVAYMIEEAEARQWRSSWAILRPQPGEPLGPWA